LLVEAGGAQRVEQLFGDEPHLVGLEPAAEDERERARIALLQDGPGKRATADPLLPGLGTIMGNLQLLEHELGHRVQQIVLVANVDISRVDVGSNAVVAKIDLQSGASMPLAAP
jgi:hypothetical protein